MILGKEIRRSSREINVDIEVVHHVGVQGPIHAHGANTRAALNLCRVLLNTGASPLALFDRIGINNRHAP
jgi:hypothetical protein